MRDQMNILLRRSNSLMRPLNSPRRVKTRYYMLCAAVAIFICLVLLYIYSADHKPDESKKLSFVGINGTHFVVDGKTFYVNGWNSYWMMVQAVDESNRHRITEMFQAGTELGLSVCRSWAFNDGDYHALQVSLGNFDERVFEALDWVIMEARKHGIRLLLSLVNNLQHFGGKTQYVKWAMEAGFGVSSSNDSFFYDPTLRNYFKNYLKTVLTRKNHLTGIEYRNDPTIFAWELMNEPECVSDSSGDTLHEWIEEMADYIKTIDKNHLLTIGLEGFYGPSSPPEKLLVNPGSWYSTLGSDFLRNSKIASIDFASAHVYPDQWIPKSNLDEKIEYVSKWLTSHIVDCEKELKKPILFTEFGLSNKSQNFNESQRLLFYKSIFDIIYDSAKKKGAGAGAFLWQFMVEGMEQYNDEFGIFPGKKPSMDRLIKEHSCRVSALQHGKEIPEGSTTC